MHNNCKYVLIYALNLNPFLIIKFNNKIFHLMKQNEKN